VYAQIAPRNITDIASTVPAPSAVTLWPLVFQLSHQAVITHFGLASAAQYREAPKITKITKITKKK
jgi:hypothetical protein